MRPGVKGGPRSNISEVIKLIGLSPVYWSLDQLDQRSFCQLNHMPIDWAKRRST